MSPRLTKPGMRSANLTGKLHPKTGEPLVPLGYLKNGTAVWPVLGAASNDPDDPHYTGKGGEDDDSEDDEDEDDIEEDEDDDEEDDSKSKKRTAKKSKKTDDEEDEEDDDEEDSRIHRASEQAKKYRLRLRAKEKEFDDLKARLQAIEDETKAPDEVAARQISELKTANQTLNEQVRVMTAQLAFFKSNTVTWIDPGDAFALAERSGLFDDLVDEDGTIDERELRRGLKELARRKPHLVKKDEGVKARSRKPKDDDEDDEQEEETGQRPATRSAAPQNGRRKGQKNTTDRAALAKKFPVLNRL